LEVERRGKRLAKEKEIKVKGTSSGKSEITDKPLLYPLHILSEGCDHRSQSVVSSLLRDISITLPNGIRISVGEADSRGIYSLVHGKEW